jgi:hypothetical protein
MVMLLHIVLLSRESLPLTPGHGREREFENVGTAFVPKKSAPGGFGSLLLLGPAGATSETICRTPGGKTQQLQASKMFTAAHITWYVLRKWC